MMECKSCRKEFSDGVSFACPHCNKEKIARCLKCKKMSVKYKCKCGFVGP